MGLTDRQAADLRREDAVSVAYGVMTRHKQEHRMNPAAAFRSGLLEALPALRKTLIDIYSALDGAGESPLREELVQVITDRITAFIKSNQAGQHGNHSAGTARTAVNLIQRYSMGVARDLDLAVHARRKSSAIVGASAKEAQVTLVMMTVNPETGEEDEQKLAVEREQKGIVKVRDGSRFQSRVRMEHLPDANFAGLAKSLRLHKPTLLHVTGHGRPDGSIVLRDEEGQPYPMNAEGLAKLFSVHKQTLRVVVLNACYSQGLADLLVTDIDCVVGMTEAIDDEAAILFSEVFYDALFDGAAVGDAFDTAVSALLARHVTEAVYPCLKCRPGVDPRTLRILE